MLRYPLSKNPTRLAPIESSVRRAKQPPMKKVKPPRGEELRRLLAKARKVSRE